MTPEAIRKKDLKNKLWRRYKRSRCDYDLDVIMIIQDIPKLKMN